MDPALVLALALGAVLRIHRLSGDLPYVFHYDEPTLVDNAVWLLQHGTLNPHFFHYPTGLIYLLAAIFGLVLCAGRIFGAFGTGAEAIAWLAAGSYPQPPEGGVLYFYPTIGVTALYMIGRAISAVASIATIALIYAVARRAVPERGVARWAAIFLALSPLAVEHAHLITTDSTAAACATAALLAVLAAEGREIPAWIRAGFLCGLAAGVKYNAGLVALTLPALALWGRSRAGAARLGLAAAGAILAFLLTTPYALLDRATFQRDLGYEMRRVGSVTASFQGAEAVEDSPAEKIGAIFMADVGVALCAAAVLGIFLAVRSRRFAPVAVLVWVAAALLPQLRWQSLYARYILPALPAVLLLGAWGMSEASRILARALPAFRGRETATTLALAALILAAPTQRMIAREAARARHDPRIALTAWIEANIPEGERLALEPGGPFPSVERFSLERVDFLGRYSAEEYRARGVRYLIGSGRESRIAGESAFEPVLGRLAAIREGSDRLWEEGRYVVYRLRGASPFWEGPSREALAAGDLRRARAILEEGMTGDSAAPTPHGWTLLGEVRAEEGDTSAALAAYAEAARLDPGDVEIPLAAGNLRIEARAWDRALEEFSRAAELAPRDPLVLHNLAVARLYRARDRWRSGDPAAAREDWLAAREHAEAVAKFAPGDSDLTRIREQVSRAGRSWGFAP